MWLSKYFYFNIFHFIFYFIIFNIFFPLYKYNNLKSVPTHFFRLLPIFVLPWGLIEQKLLLISNVGGGENLEFKQTLQDYGDDDDDNKNV